VGDSSKPILTTPRRSRRNVEKHPDGGDHSTIPAYARTTSVSPWHRGRKPADNRNTDVGVHKSAWWERLDDSFRADDAGERVIATMRKIASVDDPGLKAVAAVGLVKMAAELTPEAADLALAALQSVDPGDYNALSGIYGAFFADNMEGL
jgi:hypothetical protein